MAALKTYTYGLSEIGFGEIAQDGGIASTFTPLGYTKEDSCTLTTEDPELTEHYAEEVSDPVVTISKKGKTEFNFSLINPDVTALQTLFGGTADTTTNTWTAPAGRIVVEKSVRITPDAGFNSEICRAKLAPRVNAEFSKKGILVIDVTGSVLTPTKAGEPPMKWTLIQS